MLEFAAAFPEVFEILPRERSEIDVLHRQYVANVIYYVAGKDFTDWIDRQLQDRTKRLTDERNMNITMDPEIF